MPRTILLRDTQTSWGLSFAPWGGELLYSSLESSVAAEPSWEHALHGESRHVRLPWALGVLSAAHGPSRRV